MQNPTNAPTACNLLFGEPKLKMETSWRSKADKWEGVDVKIDEIKLGADSTKVGTTVGTKGSCVWRTC